MTGFTIELPPPEQLSQMIARSPHAFQYQRMLDDLLRQEQEKRRQFHETLAQYEGRKVEFVYGEIVEDEMPVKKIHNDIVWRLLRLLREFVELHELGYVGYEKVMISLQRNDYEPDICFFNVDIASPFTEDQTRFPAPNFAVEVLSPSTYMTDRGTKFADYEANGVQEYWIIDPENEMLEQYVLLNSKYVLQIKAPDGIVQSVTVPGFEIPIRALFDQQENLIARKKLL